MTITKTIEMARKMLNAGNRGAYARVMSAAIRSSMSERAANSFLRAIAEDRAEDLFVFAGTGCPIAK